MTVEFLPMAEPLHIPETRFITDAEREELRALYAEAEALADSADGEPAKEERPPEIAVNTRKSVL